MEIYKVINENGKMLALANTGLYYRAGEIDQDRVGLLRLINRYIGTNGKAVVSEQALLETMGFVKVYDRG